MRRTPIMVCHKQGAPRKSQGNARDFWGKGETVLRHLRIAFRQAAATQMLFRRGGAEENRVVPSSAMAAGFSSDHGNFFRQHGKNFVNIIAPRGSCAFGAKFSLRSNANRRPIGQGSSARLFVRAWFSPLRGETKKKRQALPVFSFW